jgi:hypothetical protein
MFERFTEKARRVIFFARFEASRYGSTTINTEHLLLGVLREDNAILSLLVSDRRALDLVATKLEQQIDRLEPIPLEDEIPFSLETSRALYFARDEADQLAHRNVGTEHLLLGILRVEGCLAAKILCDHGLDLRSVRGRLRSTPEFAPGTVLPVADTLDAQLVVENFLSVVRSGLTAPLIAFFSSGAQFVDAFGQLWHHDELHKNIEVLFAPYAARKATFQLEKSFANDAGAWIASALWTGVPFSNQTCESCQRMSLVLTDDAGNWRISLIQVTPVVRT